MHAHSTTSANSANRSIVNGAAAHEYRVNGKIPIAGCVIDQAVPSKKP